MSKSVMRPARDVSDPMTRFRSSLRLENIAILAAIRVRILVASSRGGTVSAGNPLGHRLSFSALGGN